MFSPILCTPGVWFCPVASFGARQVTSGFTACVLLFGRHMRTVGSSVRFILRKLLDFEIRLAFDHIFPTGASSNSTEIRKTITLTVGCLF